MRYPLNLPHNPRHADLLKSFGAHPKMVFVLPAADLAAYRALAQEARNAPMVCIPAAMDAGGTGYQAWAMNGDGVYSSIELGQEGDVSCRNLSPAGQRVRAWLRTVTGIGSSDPRFPARTCRVRPCSFGKDCFSVTYCEYVPDCSWCEGSTVCVEGTLGRKHCSLAYHSQCTGSPCACFGNAICPGGPGDCREATGGALTRCGYVKSYAEQGTGYTGTDAEHHPVVYVDWCDAYAYCLGVGKRLCGAIGGGGDDGEHEDATRSQWYRACSSGRTYRYPYGNTFQPSYCDGSELWNGDPSISETVAVGSLPNCVTSAAGYAGVYDLLGNVNEWEDSCDGPGRSAGCCSRGGSFVNSDGALNCGCGYDIARYEANSVGGFRCCSR